MTYLLKSGGKNGISQVNNLAKDIEANINKPAESVSEICAMICPLLHSFFCLATIMLMD